MDFNENQKKAIDFYEGCCNVIACAGSGKTSVLVYRIQKLVLDHGVDPTKILAITFSKKAKENMISRLEKLLPDHYKYLRIETFHSFGYSIIRKFDPRKYEILDTDWKQKKILEEIYCNVCRIKKVSGEKIAEVIRYISMKKNHLEFPADVPADDMERIYYLYEKHKRENNILDFDDMLTKSYEILSTSEKTLAYCQDKHQFILADEMQDTNAVQYEMIRLLAKAHPNVFFVDDPLQNIYEWRNSDNYYVLHFDEEWGDKAETINLNTNYRSSQNIVKYANQFALTIPDSAHKHYVESVANRPSFKDPEHILYLDEHEEAMSITKRIADMVSSGQYEFQDFAILARTNAQLALFESAMHKKKIPYTIVDGITFVERKEIKIVLSYLRLAINENDSKAFEYIYNKPTRYLGNQFLEETKMISRRRGISLPVAMFYVADRNRRYQVGVNSLYNVIDYLQKRKKDSPASLIRDIRQFLDLDTYVSSDVSDDNNISAQTDNLDVLEGIAAEFKTLEEFVGYISSLADEKQSRTNTVKLMTIHKAKGLEFPVVFVVGVNDGVLPHKRNANINEERRLMYVAITRAEKELYLSSTEFYRDRKIEVSEFIEHLIIDDT